MPVYLIKNTVWLWIHVFLLSDCNFQVLTKSIKTNKTTAGFTLLKFQNRMPHSFKKLRHIPWRWYAGCWISYSIWATNLNLKSACKTVSTTNQLIGPVKVSKVKLHIVSEIIFGWAILLRNILIHSSQHKKQRNEFIQTNFYNWIFSFFFVSLWVAVQQPFICSKSTKETLEQGMKYVQNQQKDTRTTSLVSFWRLYC